MKSRLHVDSDFSMLKKFVRIDTLNSWGFNYLKRNIESNLEIKSTKTDSFFLIKNLLRPIWVNHSLINGSLQKNQWKYSSIMDIFDSLKRPGFRHDSEKLYLHFPEHLKWLVENGCERYFEATIYTRSRDLELLDNNTENSITRFKPFPDFWEEACEHLWNSAIITLDDQKY